MNTSGSEVARLRARLLAKAGNYGTAQGRVLTEGATEDNLLALRNAVGDLELAAFEYTSAYHRLADARERAA